MTTTTTTFRFFIRHEYIWYVCPITGDEKKTAFFAWSDSKFVKKAEEMAKIEHFVKYDMDKGFAMALKAFMAMSYNSSLTYTVREDGLLIVGM